MATEPVFTRTTKVWIDPDGIVRIESLPGFDERLEDAQENVDVVNSLVGSTGTLMLVDIRKLKSIDRSAREYYATARGSKSGNRAMAMLVGSAVSKIVGNFIIGAFSRATVPTRLFTNEADALDWLKKFPG